MEQQLLQALSAHYNARILKAEANLINYFRNPSAIGEHPDVVGEAVNLLDEIAAARGSLEVLNNMIAPAQPDQSPSDLKVK